MSSDLGVHLSGGKTGVLLLHDVGGSAAELRPLAAALAREGLTVACPQLTSLGGLRDVGELGTAGKLVSEAEQALGKLKTRCDHIIAVGVAYGAMLALELTRHSGGAIQAVVLHEPRAWLPAIRLPVPVALTRWVRQSMVARVLSATEVLRQAARPSPSGSAGPFGFARSEARPSSNGLRQLGALLDSVHAALPAIQQPVLLVHGQSTARSGNDGSQVLQRNLGGRVESVMIDDAHAGRQPERDAEIIAERSQRFITAVLDDLKTKRENEARRQKIAAGRSNAA